MFYTEERTDGDNAAVRSLKSVIIEEENGLWPFSSSIITLLRGSAGVLRKKPLYRNGNAAASSLKTPADLLKSVIIEEENGQSPLYRKDNGRRQRGQKAHVALGARDIFCDTGLDFCYDTVVPTNYANLCAHYGSFTPARLKSVTYFKPVVLYFYPIIAIPQPSKKKERSSYPRLQVYTTAPRRSFARAYIYVTANPKKSRRRRQQGDTLYSTRVAQKVQVAARASFFVVTCAANDYCEPSAFWDARRVPRVYLSYVSVCIRVVRLNLAKVISRIYI